MKTEALGTHLLIELYDCSRPLLDNSAIIEKAMIGAAKQIGATIVSSHINQFNPIGISGVVIIAESHLTIHTWPEYGYAAVDIFTCGELLDTTGVRNYLEQQLGSKKSTEQEIKRGFITDQIAHSKA